MHTCYSNMCSWKLLNFSTLLIPEILLLWQPVSQNNHWLCFSRAVCTVKKLEYCTAYDNYSKTKFLTTFICYPPSLHTDYYILSIIPLYSLQIDLSVSQATAHVKSCKVVGRKGLHFTEHTGLDNCTASTQSDHACLHYLCGILI